MTRMLLLALLSLLAACGGGADEDQPPVVVQAAFSHEVDTLDSFEVGLRARVLAALPLVVIDAQGLSDPALQRAKIVARDYDLNLLL